MNRAFTVWLDLSRSDSALTDAAAVPQIVLPLPALVNRYSQPLTKQQMAVRFMHFLWTRRYTIAGLLACVQLLRKLREWSVSRHVVRSLKGPIDSSLFPQYINSPSTGLWLFTRAWRVPPESERGIVFFVHAYREHIGRYEPLAAALNAAGYSCYGHDHQGHGQSGGERGYVESFAHYVLDALHYRRTILAETSAAGVSPKPTFLLGHSMGATIALQMARVEAWRVAAEEEDSDMASEAAAALHARNSVMSGVQVDEERKQSAATPSVAASPLHVGQTRSSPSASFSLSASDALHPSGWQLSGLLLSAPALIPHSLSPLLQILATVLADVLPKCRPAGMVQQPSLLSELASVPRQWALDPLTVQNAAPARWGHEILQAMEDARTACSEVSPSLPVLILQGRRDRYISPVGAQFAYEHLASEDKQIRWFDQGSHDLWLDTVRHEFVGEVKTWLQQHSGEELASGGKRS